MTPVTREIQDRLNELWVMAQRFETTKAHISALERDVSVLRIMISDARRDLAASRAMLQETQDALAAERRVRRDVERANRVARDLMEQAIQSAKDAETRADDCWKETLDALSAQSIAINQAALQKERADRAEADAARRESEAWREYVEMPEVLK